jgi:hypothetical protein
MQSNLALFFLGAALTLNLACASDSGRSQSSSQYSSAQNVTPSWAPLKWDGVAGATLWTRHLMRVVPVLGDALVKAEPADLAAWCPNYQRLEPSERAWVWASLISAIAELESRFHPEQSYREIFKDSEGENVVSRGLLQISMESGRAYGCEIPEAEALHDPLVNLSCGVRILSRWIPQDGVIASNEGVHHLGAARYWSVFRKPAKLQEMQDWMRSLPACRRL